jgi:hypothetical protein
MSFFKYLNKHLKLGFLIFSLPCLGFTSQKIVRPSVSLKAPGHPAIHENLSSGFVRKQSSTGLHRELWGGADIGGGDDVALDFQGALITAIANLRLKSADIFKKLSGFNTEQILSKTRIVVGDDVLDIKYKDIIQNSTAANDPQSGLILINRTRWNSITNPILKEGIALHEFLSLVGIEATGYYPISSQYIALMEADPTSLPPYLEDDPFQTLPPIELEKSEFGVIGALFEGAKEPISMNDFDNLIDLTLRKTSTSCFLSYMERPTSSSAVTVVKISESQMGEGGPSESNFNNPLPEKIFIGMGIWHFGKIPGKNMDYLRRLFKYIDMKVSPLEIIQHFHKMNSESPSRDTVRNGTRVIFRKNHNWIVFKIEGQDASSSAYGYCF